MNKMSVGIFSGLMALGCLDVSAKVLNKKHTNAPTPIFTEHSFESTEFFKEKSSWSKIKRKLASDTTFNQSDLSPDYKKIRDEWLKIQSANEIEHFLKKTLSEYNSLSEDSKYFMTQLHPLIALRGIVWRARPLFEHSKGLLGNKSTHVSAVQFLRTAISSFKTILPSNQSDAVIHYFTEPSIDMTKKDQFQTVTDFQNFMMSDYIPFLQDSIKKLEVLSKNASDKIFVWDNKMVFGQGTFEDDIQRFRGHGVAEIHLTIASLYRASHDVLVYCAYNQDYSIQLMGEIGSHLGVDSSLFASKNKDLGLTDEERVKLVKNAVKKHHFLELRNYQGSQYGSQLMKQAYVALKNSVIFADRSYHFLQGQDSSKVMAINPLFVQNDLSPQLNKGITNMKAVVSGPAEVRDPISGETVSLHLSAFYFNPPQSLGILLPTQFEGGEIEKSIKNKQGEVLKVRNYLRGRSIAWDNNAWKSFVPSAEGKDSNYMAEARKTIQYSFGTSSVFGLTHLFVD
jgi:hypothetical protein